jgi:hypothetical protein
LAGFPSMKIKGNPHTTAELAPKRNAFSVAVRGDRLYVKAWPRKRGKATSGYALYHQLEFGKAAYLASHALPFELETARFFQLGTDMVPRDFLTMAAMGLLNEIIDQDGNHWRSWRMTNPNPQIVLDLITVDEGAIVFRAPEGWIPAVPNALGQVLTYIAPGVLGWQTPPSTGLSAAMVSLNGDKTAQNYSAVAGIEFQTTDYDSGGWTDLVNFPKRLTPPAGVTLVVVSASQSLADVATAVTTFASIRQFDSGGTLKRIWGEKPENVGTTRWSSMTTGPVPVAAGDFFQNTIDSSTDTSITVRQQGTFFSAQALG